MAPIWIVIREKESPVESFKKFLDIYFLSYQAVSNVKMSAYILLLETTL